MAKQLATDENSVDTAAADEAAAVWRARAEAAEQALERKSRFLASMVHELREPMNGVLGLARQLQDSELRPAQAQLLAGIADSGEHLLTIINDLLDQSRMEAGHLELDMIDFDLADFMTRLNGMIAPRAAKKNLEFSIYLAPRLPTLLRGDPVRLRQILLNLLGNALKFTESGAIQVEVSGQRRSDGAVALSFAVQDTGMGIPEAFQGRLFTDYAQATLAVTRVHGGSGLGLAVCRRLVDLMHGDIHVTSVEGQGTRFTVELTLPEATNLVYGTTSGGTLDLRAHTLLLVDPDAATAQSLAEAARTLGLRVTACAYGAQALTWLRRHSETDGTPVIALIDRDLPDMSGESLGRQVRRDPVLRTVYLLLQARSGMRGDAARANAIGYAAYLPKPLTPPMLAECLRHILAYPPHTVPFLTVHQLRERKRRTLNVLLVDDDAINRKVASLPLTGAGHRVHSVVDGAQAVAAVRAKRFDLVLMDLQMPVMDGLSACRAIRGLPDEAGNLPIIAVTANAMAGEDARCFAAGMDDYITKPINAALLLQKVNSWGSWVAT